MSDIAASSLAAFSAVTATARTQASFAALRRQADVDRQAIQAQFDTARAAGNVTSTRGQLVNILV